MRQVTLQEIGAIAAASRDALYSDAHRAGYEAPKIYLLSDLTAMEERIYGNRS